MMHDEIEHRFMFHAPKDEQVQATHHLISNAGAKLAHTFDQLVPEGEEKKLAIRYIEQATMWANAALARANS